MYEEEIPTIYAVRYKATGKVFGRPDPDEKPPLEHGKYGIHGRYHTREEAEKGLEACLRWFNTRQVKRKDHAYGDGLARSLELGANHPKAEADEFLDPVQVVVAWIDEERGGNVIKSGEIKCDGEKRAEKKPQKKELAMA